MVARLVSNNPTGSDQIGEQNFRPISKPMLWLRQGVSNGSPEASVTTPRSTGLNGTGWGPTMLKRKMSRKR